VKVIIAEEIQASATNLKPEDDFEIDLGATPTQVSLILYDLEEEYKITIPDSDATRIKTVGEAITYIEHRVSPKERSSASAKQIASPSRKKPPSKQNPATTQQATNPSPEAAPPSPEGAATATGRVITIADRVKVIIARQLLLPASRQLKREDDFEMDLGATPTQVSLILYDLEEEYKVKIPDSDAKKIKTVGEAITYIEKEEK
jgi:acyl carrier protein